MRRAFALHLFPLLLAASVAMGATGATGSEEESWQLLLMNGHEAGYIHGITRRLPAPMNAWETSLDTLMRMKRMGGELEISMGQTTVEDADGNVLRIRQTMDMSSAETVYEGVVQDGVLTYTTTSVGPPRKSTIEWSSEVIGPRAVERKMRSTGFEPGTTISFQQFDFMIGAPLTLTARFEGIESVDVAGRSRRLHKVVVASQADGMDLPESIQWVADDGSTIKSTTTMMGLKMDTFESDERTIAAFMEKEGGAAEVFMQSTITANIRLPRPRSLTHVRYRIQPKRQGEALPALDDERQTLILEPDGSALLDIVVRVPPEDRRQKVPIRDPNDAMAEYLEPNSMLQSDATAIIDLARATIGKEEDAWNAGVQLERAVNERIRKKSMNVAFASALEVCDSGEGDCSEHAVLLAALCRAVGIPSRVAMGLVYVGGIFGGHAWTEVSIDGEWYALDGTIGRGSVDPTHVRFGVTSLRNGGLSAGLFGILKGLGAIDLEILSYDQAGRSSAVSKDLPRSRVEQGRFFDHVEGVSFAIPEDWTAKGGEPDILEMSNRFVLAELTDGAGGSIRVVARQVPYEFDLAAWSAEVEQRSRGGALTRVPRRIADGDGLVLTTRSGDATRRSAGRIVGDTLYVVESTGDTEDSIVAFETVAASLHVN